MTCSYIVILEWDGTALKGFMPMRILRRLSRVIVPFNTIWLGIIGLHGTGDGTQNFCAWEGWVGIL